MIEEEESKDRRRKKVPRRQKREDVGEEDDLKTRAVLFVDNAKEGELARNLREVVERLKTILR